MIIEESSRVHLGRIQRQIRRQTPAGGELAKGEPPHARESNQRPADITAIPEGAIALDLCGVVAELCSGHWMK
jgi:hypothetical protein